MVVSDAKLDAAALRDLRLLRERGAELWLIDVGGARPEVRHAFEGVVPLARAWGAPEPSPLTPEGTPTPDSVLALTTGAGRVDRLR